MGQLYGKKIHVNVKVRNSRIQPPKLPILMMGTTAKLDIDRKMALATKDILEGHFSTSSSSSGTSPSKADTSGSMKKSLEKGLPGGRDPE